MDILDKNIDYNSQAVSILVKMQLNKYNRLVKYAFEQEGNIDGQRNVISRSAAASKIRERMVMDFNKGGVFPPVVLGVVLEEEDLKELMDSEEVNEVTEIFYDILKKYKREELSIIDGMQRTNIYQKSSVGNEEKEIRVEFWLASDINRLLYRMLVLNTGQVPWNVRRQLEIIYKPTIEKIKEKIEMTDPVLFSELQFFDVNDNSRRLKSGEFHKNQIIDLYLIYNLRNEKTDVSTQLAEEYKKLDLMETLDKEKNKNMETFIEILIAMCKLDIALGKLDFALATNDGRFVYGKDLFSSHPVRAGFVAAATQFILGRIERSRSTEQSNLLKEQFNKNVDEILGKINKENNTNDEIINFLDFSILNEWITTLPKSNVGEAERSGFKKVFISIFEEKEGLITIGEYWKNL